MKKLLYKLILLVTVHLLIFGCSNNSSNKNLSDNYQKPECFKHLHTIENKESFEEDEEPIITRIHFDATITEAINEVLKEGDPFYSEFSSTDRRLIKTKVNRTREEIYTVYFTYGVSLDPEFSFFIGDKHIFSTYAMELFIPGDGYIYVSGHTNNMFDTRKIYKLEGDSIVEIRQPYYYVGLVSKTKDTLTLYQEKELKTPIVTLPTNTDVEVLLNDDELFLVRTSFGLTGWFKPKHVLAQEIEGLFYAGD